jgi:hypothetical protein
MVDCLLSYPDNFNDIFGEFVDQICKNCIVGSCNAECLKKFIFVKEINDHKLSIVHFPKIVFSLPLKALNEGMKYVGMNDGIKKENKPLCSGYHKQICVMCLIDYNKCQMAHDVYHLFNVKMLTKVDMIELIRLKMIHLDNMGSGFRKIKGYEHYNVLSLERNLAHKYLYSSGLKIDKNRMDPCMMCCIGVHHDMGIKNNIFHFRGNIKPFDYRTLNDLSLDIIFECGVKTPLIEENVNTHNTDYDNKILCPKCHIRPGPYLNRNERKFHCKKDTKEFCHLPKHVRELTFDEVSNMMKFITEYYKA